ncbi:serine peptidase [Mergibacter septicus]|uniref:Do family serine endopeptidase n=1 Tax=Mergibacter septicus TaxID=221402 RepID=UPI00117922DD|nr:Do family serine endopeptidase [Mergibacter septicus]AWX13605.1 serine peptidase [Mergibacter septicus]
MKKKNVLLTSLALGLGMLTTPMLSYANLPVVLEGQSIPSLAPMLDKVLPAVVTLSVEGQSKSNSRFQQELPQLPPEFKFFFGDQFPFDGSMNNTPQKFRALGSGVIINANKGYVLTNNHVIDGADNITVKLNDGREYKAKVVGKDPQSDVALIQLENAKNLTQIKVANSDQLKVGDFVVAVGNPFGLGQTVTSGIVSAKSRSADGGSNNYENYIQTDAAVNQGNSGGPLLNLKGELVGINTAIIAPSGGNVGIAFAIPSDMAMNLAHQITEHGQVTRGMLGIKGGELNANLAKAFNIDVQKGAFVSEVLPKSAAAKAGLKAGDVITALNGQALNSFAELRAKIATSGVGKVVELTYQRDGKSNTVKVTLQSDDDNQINGSGLIPALKGAELSSYNLKGQKGVEVRSVQKQSPAAQIGLQKGDIIIGINRTKVNNIAELRKILEKKPEVVALNIQRGDSNLFILTH